METKQCSLCKRVFPLTNEYFNYRDKKRGKFHSRCKECLKINNSKFIKESKERNNIEQLNLYISKTDKETVYQNAEKLNMSMNQYATYVLLNNKPIKVIVPVGNEELEQRIEKLKYELAKIGNNINQLSKNANISKSVNPKTVETLINIMGIIQKEMSCIEEEMVKAYKVFD